MNDPEIREVIKKQFLQKYKNPDFSIVLEEVGILNGSSIIDIAVFSKAYNLGFEIKSAKDSLVRLPKQLVDYLQVFDYLTVITQPSHLDDVLSLVPSFVGIILVYDNGTFDYVRNPTFNSSLKKEKLIKLLWRDEVYSFLRANNFKNISKLSNAKVKKMACDNFSLQAIRELVFNTLKNRTNWK